MSQSSKGKKQKKKLPVSNTNKGFIGKEDMEKHKSKGIISE